MTADMTAEVWISIGLGAGIGLLYGVASLLTARWAARFRDKQFMLLVFGGMTARLFVAVAVVTLVLVLAPVRDLLFVGSFLATFVVGLVLEIWTVHRRQVVRRREEQDGGEQSSDA